MLDLISHVLHEHEKVAVIVGVLDGCPQIGFQHGAESGLSALLPQPLAVMDGAVLFPGKDDGQPVLPAQAVGDRPYLLVVALRIAVVLFARFAFYRVEDDMRVDVFLVVMNGNHRFVAWQMLPHKFLRDRERQFGRNLAGLECLNDVIALYAVRFAGFSDYFTASIVVATLLNEAFVLRCTTQTDTCIDVDGIAIEKQVVRKTASPRTLRYGKKEYIIFPYFYDKGLQRYTEDAFSTSFPNAMSHLRKYYDKLVVRDSDKNSKWFEYGRSQALATICQKKLLLSTIVTKRVEVYELGEDVVPYSGIYIRTKGAVSLSVAKQILQSNEFYEYVRDIGIYASGESIRITAKDIENYEFEWRREYDHGKTQL